MSQSGMAHDVYRNKERSPVVPYEHPFDDDDDESTVTSGWRAQAGFGTFPRGDNASRISV